MDAKGSNMGSSRRDIEIVWSIEWKLEEDDRCIFKWNEDLNGGEEYWRYNKMEEIMGQYHTSEKFLFRIEKDHLTFFRFSLFAQDSQILIINPNRN